MRHLYLFDETSSNAAIYGIGTYIRMLLSFLRGMNMPISVVKMLSDYEKVIIHKEENIRYIYIPKLTPEKANRSNYYRSVSYIIIPFISKHENNIFHYNYVDCHDLAFWLKTYFPLSKHILTIHYRVPGCFDNFEKERDLINIYCDRIIVLTKQACSSMQTDYNVMREKLVIVENSICDAFFSSKFDKKIIKESLGIDHECKIILFVGRLDENKNPRLLLQSFENILKIHKNVHLILVGKGDYDSLYSALSHYGKVSFTGFLNPNILHKIYLCADLGVIPSLYEEFGYVAIEMMMYGIPIIANRTGGLVEIVDDGISGDLLDLYKSRNEEESICLLSNAISRLLFNDFLIKNYSKNARERFLKYYSVDNFKDKMFKIYDELS